VVAWCDTLAAEVGTGATLRVYSRFSTLDMKLESLQGAEVAARCDKLAAWTLGVVHLQSKAAAITAGRGGAGAV